LPKRRCALRRSRGRFPETAFHNLCLRSRGCCAQRFGWHALRLARSARFLNS
jgi:hypothetical protein